MKPNSLSADSEPVVTGAQNGRIAYCREDILQFLSFTNASCRNKYYMRKCRLLI